MLTEQSRGSNVDGQTKAMNNDIPQIAATEILELLTKIEHAARNVRKNRATWRKYVKAHKAGNVTDDQLNNARNVLRESIANDLEFAFEAGLHLGQGDLGDHKYRAEGNAAELI